MRTSLPSLFRRCRPQATSAGAAAEPATPEDLYLCYRHILGREPDERGWTHWKRLLDENRLSLRQLFEGFVRSPEAIEHLVNRGRSSGGRADEVRCVQLEGFRLYVDPTDRLVSAGILADAYEPHVTRFLRPLLQPDTVFVDVGANVGFFTVMAAGLVGPAGRVIAIEPRRDNVALLTLSLRLNGLENVTIHPVAVTEAPRVYKLLAARDSSLSQLVDPSWQVLGAASGYDVPAVDLDSLLDGLHRVDLVKVDVDGMEVGTFRGMRRSLERHRPILVFEFSPPLLASNGITRPQQLLEEIVALGYELSILPRTGPSESGPSTFEAIMEAHARSGSTHLDLAAHPVTGHPGP